MFLDDLKAIKAQMTGEQVEEAEAAAAPETNEGKFERLQKEFVDFTGLEK